MLVETSNDLIGSSNGVYESSAAFSSMGSTVPSHFEPCGSMAKELIAPYQDRQSPSGRGSKLGFWKKPKDCENGKSQRRFIMSYLV